jgi:macrolide transport system ATP-binding/permease protein
MRVWSLSTGIFFDEIDQKRYASVMLLGTTLAEQLFPDGDDSIGQYVMLNNAFYQVIGILNAKGVSSGGGDLDDEAYIPITTAQLKFFGNQFLSGIIVQVCRNKCFISSRDTKKCLIKTAPWSG